MSMNVMSSEVVIVAPTERALMQLTVAFRGTPYDVTAVEPVRLLRTAKRLAERHPAAMVVSLDGTENVADIRALLAASPATRFLFLAPQMPPRAALSRVVHAFGGEILSADEAPIVVVATLVALLAPDDDPEIDR
jgi:hypothetical protein